MVDLKKIVEEYDFVIAVDASSSMATRDVKAPGLFGGRVSRWDSVAKLAVEFAAEVDKIDTDGVGLVFFGSHVQKFRNASSRTLERAFQSASPHGGTPLDLALTASIDLLNGSPKKKFIAVFTDGVPNNRAAVRKVIVDQANSQLTDDELTILFIQVGSDSSAAEYLRVLDDDLKEAKFDIVDAKTAEQAAKFKTVLDLVVHAIED